MRGGVEIRKVLECCLLLSGLHKLTCCKHVHSIQIVSPVEINYDIFNEDLFVIKAVSEEETFLGGNNLSTIGS